MDGGRLRHAGEGGAGRKRGRRPDHGCPIPALSHGARSIASPPPAFAAGARGDRWDPGRRSEVLCLPHPDWLHHTLTVTGPEAELAAFRQAAPAADRCLAAFLRRTRRYGGGLENLGNRISGVSA